MCARRIRRDNALVRRVLSVALLAIVAAAVTAAQVDPLSSRDRGRRPPVSSGQPGGAYDGRFTFVRLRWQPGGRFRGFWGSAWNHDYPRAEEHLAQIIRELTLIDARIQEHRLMTLDDPALFHYPIAFMWEPGFWTITKREAEAFRAYLLKGGFAVFEDFDGPSQWANFVVQMREVLPDARFVKLEQSHPIFSTFFTIHDIDSIVHPMTGQRPSYYGVYEQNDPTKRLMVIANFDNDVPEYWEWSGEGLFPFSTSNEAYKLGVNYAVYGMTH